MPRPIRELVPACPDCGEWERVRCTHLTSTGFFCRCGKCGWMWHHSIDDDSERAEIHHAFRVFLKRPDDEVPPEK